jgi:hypothetical protein
MDPEINVLQHNIVNFPPDFIVPAIYDSIGSNAKPFSLNSFKHASTALAS